MDKQMARDFAERFEEFGLHFAEPLEFTDIPNRKTLPATLAHAQGFAPYRVAHTPSLTLSSLDWLSPHYASGNQILLFGPRVTERSAETFRALGINYIDRAGNASIAFEGVHIDVRGKRPHRSAPTNGARMTRGGVNLFSPKRAQVIFSILSWPELLDAPVRSLAHTAGVSLGQTQRTLELLTQHGYLTGQKQLVPNKRESLIDQWAATYRMGLGSATKSENYSGEVTRIDPGTMTVYVSGEAAVPALLRPETQMLYTEALPTELIRAHRWRRNDEDPNIFLRRKFWQHPQDHEAPGVYEAPRLLIYADLLASNDSRQHEAALQLREEMP